MDVTWHLHSNSLCIWPLRGTPFSDLGPRRFRLKVQRTCRPAVALVLDGREVRRIRWHCRSISLKCHSQSARSYGEKCLTALPRGEMALLIRPFTANNSKHDAVTTKKSSRSRPAYTSMPAFIRLIAPTFHVCICRKPVSAFGTQLRAAPNRMACAVPLQMSFHTCRRPPRLSHIVFTTSVKHNTCEGSISPDFNLPSSSPPSWLPPCLVKQRYTASRRIRPTSLHRRPTPEVGSSVCDRCSLR